MIPAALVYHSWLRKMNFMNCRSTTPTDRRAVSARAQSRESPSATGALFIVRLARNKQPSRSLKLITRCFLRCATLDFRILHFSEPNYRSGPEADHLVDCG